MNEAPTKIERFLIPLLLIGSIASALALIVFHSLNHSINISTFHLDGAFQTASSLFRIDSGQAPGRDFLPYLGVGPLLVIFPFFKIAGGTLSASAFAAKFVTLALSWLAVSVLWHLIFRPKRILISLLGGAAVFVGADMMARYLSLPNVFAFGFEPGNSLKPIRAALPYLVALALYLLINNVKDRRQRDLAAGLIVGVSLLWSNDYAIPTAGLFSLFLFGVFYLKERETSRFSAITFSLSAFLSWVILLSLITAGHPLELLKYNFLDVAADQWWYFGPYAQASRIFEVDQLFRLISHKNHFPLLVLLTASLFAINTKKIEHVLLVWIGLTLFAGGSLASVGGHLKSYFSAFYWWGAITVVLVLLRVIQLLVYRIVALAPEKLIVSSRWLIVVVAAVAFTFFVYGANNNLVRYEESLTAAKNDTQRFFVPEFDGYLGIEWQDYVSYARRYKDSRAIEDYWGIWNSLNRAFPPWPVDSVIHALGNVREIAKSALHNADLVITTRYITSSEWQPWGISQNFWFYEDLLLRWEPELVSPRTIVWRKTDKIRNNVEVGCQISEQKNSFALDSDKEGFFKVTLEYESFGKGRYLLMLKNNISFSGGAQGHVSLPPGKSTATIPALITQYSGNVFGSKLVGNDTATFVIESCSAKEISYRNNDVLYEVSLNDFYITDGVWDHGIARQHPEFFVPNQTQIIEKYKAGRYISFRNGDFRVIQGTNASGRYLHVNFEGPALDYAIVGRPDEFHVVDTPDRSTQDFFADFYVTNETWDAGLARTSAGFMLPNTYHYLALFVAGKHVRFSNGETRKITQVTTFEDHLKVDVEGAILDPQKSGLPSSYAIVEI